jgi:hypothetical protein
MTKNRCLLAACTIALLAASSPVLAVSPLASRTFVSGGGTDTGACPTTDPCRTFAYALTQTAASGEIIVLSSAGYGTVTINKAVSIINTSNFAGVTVASGNGITIAAGTTDAVTLRGLTIDGGGTGSNGIVFNSGGSLTIDQCDVMNFVGAGPGVGNGIFIQPTSGSSKIVITNTTASNNGYTGVYYYPAVNSTATAGITIDRVSALNNLYGIAINGSQSTGAATASVSNSIASFNGDIGFYFQTVTASLDASYAIGGLGSGVESASGTLVVGRSVLMNNNGYGIFNSGGTINSYKDNRVAGNGGGPVGGAAGTATLY